MTGKELKIGNVFTPLRWGRFAIERFGIFRRWMDGATVFDPTMGTGNLMEALVEYGREQGYAIQDLPLSRLYGNELNSGFHAQALKKFAESYGVDMSSHFWNEDILQLTPRKFDILLGNPPWQNFVDLPEAYKNRIKAEFIRYDLVRNRRDLLLGGSRIDLSALIIQRSIRDFLVENGDAFFFMPLSLLLNDGAHRYFRTYRIDRTTFAPLEVYDLKDTDAFPGIATRYGLVHFKRDTIARFPVPYQRHEKNAWIRYEAGPLFHPADPLSISRPGNANPLAGLKPFVIDRTSTPRQGINTCGTNHVFFFKSCIQQGRSTCIVNDTTELPSKYISPLLTSENFKEDQLIPHKWVLLPYDPDGRPLDRDQLQAEPTLWDYLLRHEEILRARKGSFIGAWIRRGYWWALLGVGPYNFMPYKIVWQAYGKKDFKPILVEGHWQANQSLQAFMPARTRKEAERILKELQQPAIESYLLSLKMEGTMNWAQPGRIRKLIKYRENTLPSRDADK